MRSRRQRTLNRRYVSDEFTSIFTENRSLAPHLGLVEANQEVVEQTVEVDTTVEMDSSMFIQEFEVSKNESSRVNISLLCLKNWKIRL
jgi:hypothetical protein